jgi:hypothetical protein
MTRKILALTALTIAALIGGDTLAQAQQPIDVRFDGRDLDAWVVQHCPPETSVTEGSDTPPPGHSQYFRFQVNTDGERCFGLHQPGNGSRFRAQIIPPQNTPFVRPTQRFSTQYYDFYVRYPAGFGPMSDVFCETGAFPAGSIRLGCSGIEDFHPGVLGQVIHMDTEPNYFTAPMQKGQGWHHFVLKVHHDVAPNGTVSLWHRPPGASSFTRALNEVHTDTWNTEFGGVEQGGSLIVQSLYHGPNDPNDPRAAASIGADPWDDQTGVIVSACHEIDPACSPGSGGGGGGSPGSGGGGGGTGSGKASTAITLRVSDSTPARGSRVRFFGSVRPDQDGRRVRLQRRKRGGSYRTIARIALRDAGSSRSKFSKRLRVMADAAFRARLPADAAHEAGASRARRVNVP